jgi:exodeoxyribonuclease-5
MVDEASMVPSDIHEDLLKWQRPILYVGDPGQLEPVNDTFNLMEHPDLILTEIHRQDEGSHILNLATVLRNQRMPKKYGEFGDVRLIPKEEFWEESLYSLFLNESSQILVGTNETRFRMNMKARRAKGLPNNTMLCKGEKIIFLRNNYEIGVYNGLMGTVLNDPIKTRYQHGKLGINVLQFDFKPDWTDQIIRGIRCLAAQFGELEKSFRFSLPEWLCFADYGYAVTTHKSQGSEWDHVLVLDEIAGSWNPWRWRYTAVTRAKKGLVYAF